MQIVPWALRALLAAILLKVILSYRTSRRNAHKARSLGCGCIPAYPHPVWDPLGLVMVFWFFGKRQNKKLPEACCEAFDFSAQHEKRDVRTFMINAVGSSRLWTSDPENIEALLSTQFKDFELGPVRCGNFEPLLGRGIFNTNGKEWTYHRALLRPVFTTRQIEEFDIEWEHCGNLLQALPVHGDGWTSSVDLQTILMRHTTDVSTDFLFGHSANAQLSQLPDAPRLFRSKTTNLVTGDEFTVAWDVAQNALMDRFQFFEAYWIYNPPSFRKACKTSQAFVDHYVDLALKKSATDLESGNKYIFLNELVKQTRDRVELRDGLTNVLQAGRDSNSSLLGWLFFLLARNQSVFRRLREAILESFGTDSSTITYASLKDCTYLQYCLNETLRLYPPVPINATRNALADTTLPRGGGPDGRSPVFVPKGQGIDYIPFRTHRDPKYWGPDAGDFRPERFRGRKQAWDYLPFNGGPRSCLGQQYALASTGYTVTRLLQEFDAIENTDASKEVLYHSTLTMRSGNGVKVRLHKASQA